MIKIKNSNRWPTKSSRREELSKSWNQLMSRGDLGFFQTPSREKIWASSEQRGREIRESYSDLVILGIGGSSLGAKAIQGFLSDQVKADRLHVWDSLDPLVIRQAWSKLENPNKTHFLLISKSGSTLETLSLAQWVSDKLEEKNLSLAKQSTAVTELKDNTLKNWADKFSVPVLEVPLDVGGRFSVLTPVALVAAEFMGVDIRQLRQGALNALEDKEFVLRLAEESLASFERKEWITLFWYYSEFFMDLGRWTQQLWAESIAKAKDNLGRDAQRVSSPMVALGPADQHSILQQVMEGARDKWVWIVEAPEQNSEALQADVFDSRYKLKGLNLDRIHKVQSESIATALDQSGVSVLTLAFSERSAKSLGFYFMSLQLLIGVLGEALNINAFDQPGVELGKVIARDLLSK